MELKKEKYKGFEITYEVNINGLFTASALGLYICHDNNEIGFTNIKDADSAIKNTIDKFINTIPKNYEELADTIQDTLIWTSYEDCYVDSHILERIVDNFFKLYKKDRDE